MIETRVKKPGPRTFIGTHAPAHWIIASSESSPSSVYPISVTPAKQQGPLRTHFPAHIPGSDQDWREDQIRTMDIAPRAGNDARTVFFAAQTAREWQPPLRIARKAR